MLIGYFSDRRIETDRNEERHGRDGELHILDH
jgi:hypothetical protein